jgi:hypothetical protein
MFFLPFYALQHIKEKTMKITLMCFLLWRETKSTFVPEPDKAQYK